MEKIICPNCKSSKVKYKHSHPLNYHCKNCNLVFYDSRLEDERGYDKGSLISEWFLFIACVIIIILLILWLIL